MGLILYICFAVDNVQPQCTPPADVVRVLPLGAGGTTVSWQEPTATDDCGIVRLQSRSHAPGDFFPTGQTRVTYTFVDGSSNTVTCGFNIRIDEGKRSCFRISLSLAQLVILLLS